MVCWKCNGSGCFLLVYDVLICTDCDGYGIIQDKTDDKNLPKV